ncbi:replicative DNA helicase [Alphaproteobacteria bacterium]|nr:replicative DNA helicase [Alphaproteobacteria bacterium]MDA8695062.1 replicative DNA helicase [Alphaproteobacteria bacterium]
MQKSYDSLKDNDIEVILLSYLIKHPELLDTHFEHISHNLFANPENLKIFRVIEDFHQSQKNISTDTIKNYIPDIHSQTLKDLTLQIDQIVFSREIFLNYIESLQELYLRRELFKLTQDKNNESTTFQTSNNIKEIFLDLEKKIFDLSNFKKENYEFKDFASVTKSSLQLVEKAFKKKGQYSGVVSGFNDLDNMLGGLQNSDLVILAGRPSMGKTALATNIAFNAAKYYSNEEEKGSVVMFSLEMSAEQIGLRILAEQSRIPSDKLRKGELNEKDSAALSSTYQEIHQLNFFFDDSPNLTVSELRSKLRRYKKLYNIKLVLIDYLQLIKSERSRDNRVNELSEITRSLKQLAKEFDLPVVSLSQLSRQVENRDDKRPLLSDLRESGSIEQDADVVMFIYRESYYLQRNEPTRGPDESQDSYQKKHDAWKDRNEEVFNKAELIVAKQRNGPTGKIDLYFDDKYTKFLGMDKNNDH